MLTGARRGEVLGATWDQIDLAAGRWCKPPSSTKQKEAHEVPLSAPALQLLARMRADVDDAEAIAKGLERDAKRERHPKRAQALRNAAARARRRGTSAYLFPSDRVDGDRPMLGIKGSWQSLCRKAEITGVRLHDLRHTYASLLVSGGASLPLIGALLGHSQAQTTLRYAHLLDDPLRAATERVGAIVTAEGEAEIVELKGPRR